MYVETVPDAKFLRHSLEAHFQWEPFFWIAGTLTANCPANLFSRNILLTRYRKTINNGVNARRAKGMEGSGRTLLFGPCCLHLEAQDARSARLEH
jgi:hypothetical protein